MTSSPDPNTPPTTAPVTVSPLDDDDALWAEGESVAVVVAVAVTVIVTGAISVLLGDVEPDVRLKITFPAST